MSMAMGVRSILRILTIMRTCWYNSTLKDFTTKASYLSLMLQTDNVQILQGTGTRTSDC